MTEAGDTPSAPAGDDAPTIFLKIASGAFLLHGIMGLLLVGPGGSAQEVFWVTVDSVSSTIHLAIGLVGTAMTTSQARARVATVALAAGLIAWAALAALTGGALGDWASGDIEIVAAHGLAGFGGVVALALAGRERAPVSGEPL